MDDDRATDADLAKLIELVSEATSAFIRGDMRRYLALITHTDDYTLMAPTGGETIQRFEISEERLAEGIARQDRAVRWRRAFCRRALEDLRAPSGI
jgi:hypothetical protein